jgi:hypothetical protein
VRVCACRCAETTGADGDYGSIRPFDPTTNWRACACVLGNNGADGDAHWLRCAVDLELTLAGVCVCVRVWKQRVADGDALVIHCAVNLLTLAGVCACAYGETTWRRLRLLVGLQAVDLLTHTGRRVRACVWRRTNRSQDSDAYWPLWLSILSSTGSVCVCVCVWLETTGRRWRRHIGRIPAVDLPANWHACVRVRMVCKRSQNDQLVDQPILIPQLAGARACACCVHGTTGRRRRSRSARRSLSVNWQVCVCVC